MTSGYVGNVMAAIFADGDIVLRQCLLHRGPVGVRYPLSLLECAEERRDRVGTQAADARAETT
jgi:hypothetical protein